MDERSEGRINRTISIFIHVHECEERPEIVDATIPCHATDFSPHGLKCITNLSLPVGTRISITIGTNNPFTMYILQGVARWIEKRDAVQTIGISFEEGREEGKARDPNLQSWIDDFYNNFDQQHIFSAA